MTARIYLVRHGPSAHVQPGRIDRAGVHRWREAYDATGITASSAPPAALKELAESCTRIVSSDLARAVESAERIAGGREVIVSRLLREAVLPIPRWPVSMPIQGWGTIISLGWMLRTIVGADATAGDREQARSASAWLSGLAADGSTSLVVTHGVFRRLLARRLVTDGWTMVGRQGGYSNWSTWSLEKRPAAW